MRLVILQVVTHSTASQPGPLANKTNMPAKLDDSENLRFLFACFQSTEPNRVDFAEVGKQFGIQSAAARMRLCRLKDHLCGKPDTKPRKRRKSVDPDGKQQGQKKTKTKEGLETDFRGMDDEEDDEEVIINDRMKKEETEDIKDWKKLPEARRIFAHSPEHRMRAIESTADMMPPLPSTYHQNSQYQLPIHMSPQVNNMPMSQTYPSPSVATSQVPYFNPLDYRPEQRQGQQFGPYPTTPLEDFQPINFGERDEPAQ
ncbi:hypothetical protein Q7P37_006740 [Cladosporium fusiforme]